MTAAPGESGPWCSTAIGADAERPDQRWRLHLQWLLVFTATFGAKWVIFTQLWHRPLGYGIRAWDAQHYLALAEFGYPRHVMQPYSTWAFFPGTPLLIRGLRFFTGSFLAAGFVESTVMAAVASLLAFHLAARRYGGASGLRAAVMLAVAPGAFLFGMAYAEPLVLAVCLGTMLCLEHRRYALAFGLGLVAGLSSPFAMPLVLVAAYVAFRRWAVGPALVAASPVMGFLAFQLYGLARTGTFPVWFAAERTFGQGFVAANTIDRFTQSSSVGIPVTVGTSLVLAAAAFWAMGKARVPGEWWLFAIPVVCVGLFSAGSWINPRILLNAFPLELATGIVARGRIFGAVAVLSFVAMLLALAAYVVFWPNSVAQP